VLVRAEQAIRRGSGAVILGDAGIGKSHATQALARRLRTRGATVELVLATEAASTVPFGALAELLGPVAGVPGDVLEVLRSAGSRLAHRAHGGVLVVIVDDAHRLDPASAALLLQLVTRHGVRVLATVRTGAPTPDAVTALWKDARLLRVDLEPLDEDAAVDIARRLLGAPIERGTQRWLWQTSAGNPLFLRELVRSGVDRGSLKIEHGHWRRTGSIPPPGRLLDLLDERIEALTAAERRALALVVLAEPAELELLARLDALEGARQLESRGLLAAANTVGPARLRVGHPLYGEALRASLRATEARELHAELAAQLDPADPGVQMRLATWALEDGHSLEPRVLIDAAEHALSAFDPELAIRLGTAALVAAPGIDAALPLAVGLRAVGRFEEAEHRLAAVEAEARRSERVTSYLFARATNLQWGLGRPDDAHAMLARVAVDPGRTAVAAALLSSAGALREGVECAQQVLASPSTDGLALAISAVVVGNGLAVLGDPSAALAVIDHVERTARGVESEWPRAAIAVTATFYGATQWAERRKALEARLAGARAAGDDARAALCELALTRLAAPAGDLETVRRLALDALARLAFMDPRAMAPVCHAAIADAEALAGHAEAARAALQRGWALLDRAPPISTARESLQIASALVLAVEGDEPGAQEIALAGAEGAGELLLFEAEMLHLYMRVGGSATRVAARLTAIATSARATMVELWARQAVAARDADGAGLELVANEFERVGARIFAAEAAAQAAIAHAAGGSADASRRAEGYAARLAAASGANGLTLVKEMRMSALTSRERETAWLVAQGLSNPEIAARLSLSVRTVESHVYRATTKLGVHDRRALAALLSGREVW
jgi:DNA-binding CsgD family transcriptional regulator